jgi:EF hand
MTYRDTTLRLAASALAFLALSTGVALAQGGGGGGRLDRLLAMDTNHDGSISAAEMAAGREARFTAMDSNHDGFITAEEAAAGRPGGGNGGPPPGGPPPGGPPPGGGGGGGGGMMERADTDHDGKISHAEYLAQPNRMGGIDANGDGTISADEIAAARARMASGGN